MNKVILTLLSLAISTQVKAITVQNLLVAKGLESLELSEKLLSKKTRTPKENCLLERAYMFQTLSIPQTKKIQLGESKTEVIFKLLKRGYNKDFTQISFFIDKKTKKVNMFMVPRVIPGESVMREIGSDSIVLSTKECIHEFKLNFIGNGNSIPNPR